MHVLKFQHPRRGYSKVPTCELSNYVEAVSQLILGGFEVPFMSFWKPFPGLHAGFLLGSFSGPGFLMRFMLMLGSNRNPWRGLWTPV